MNAQKTVVSLVPVVLGALAPACGAPAPLADADADADTSTTDADRLDAEADGASDAGRDGDATDSLDTDGDGLADGAERRLGTDPHHPDTDRDGISDGDETGDDTDPLDPRSARAWHPEVTERPRLYFGPADLDELRRRWGESEGPSAELRARLNALARATPPEQPAEGPFDPRVSATRAAIAEAAAFVGLMTEDLEMSARAAELLAANFPDPRPLNEGLYPEGTYNLQESEALVSACSAYDLLAGTTAASDLLAPARARLLERLAAFREIDLEPGAYHNLLLFARNNHNLKVLGALGLCAMALPDRPEAAADFNEALTGVEFLLLRHQGIAEGGYAEGWHYLEYGGRGFLPLVAAFGRFIGDGSLPLVGHATITPGDPMAGRTADIADIARHPTFVNIFTNAMIASQPDGLMAPVDDSNQAPLPGGVVASLLHDGRFLWFWNLPAVGRHAARLEVLTYAALGRGPALTPPDWPLDAAFPEAGFLVLRSDWSERATWLHLQAEHGPARVNGIGHEHADGLSFQLWHQGRPLVIDPGYIDFEHHDRVKYGRDHNIVLVDGLGPEFPLDGSNIAPEGDTFILEADLDGDVATALARGELRGVRHWRRVLRLSDDLFVVADRLEADTPHRYTFVINGLAGGEVPDSRFEASPHGAAWIREFDDEIGRRRLDVTVVPLEGETAIDHRLEEHVTTWGAWELHECLDVSADMDESPGFLALLRASTGDAEPTAPTVTRPAPATATIELDDGAGRRMLALVAGSAAVTVDTPAGRRTLEPGLTSMVFDDLGELLEERRWSLIP